MKATFSNSIPPYLKKLVSMMKPSQESKLFCTDMKYVLSRLLKKLRQDSTTLNYAFLALDSNVPYEWQTFPYRLKEEDFLSFSGRNLFDVVQAESSLFVIYRVYQKCVLCVNWNNSKNTYSTERANTF